MIRNKLRIVLFVLISIFTFAEEVELKKAVDENGYEYTYTNGIYSDTREYTLENGLKVYLTKKDNTPNIYSEIVVRVGSKNDPDETTGLAHYFEHLMFKGSDKIGTIDWNKEKPLLDQIEKLYDDHKKERDPDKKKEIYKKIDAISYEASKYSVSNEYSQLVSSIGGSDLNAYTSNDSTIFTMNFPSNNVEKAMFLERSRFDNVALRGFHTELETVYEEYNLTENSGFSRVYNESMKELFKDNAYSKHPTIGTPYDLKNPSIKEIRLFFDKYYIANNMAIILSGNLEYADTIKMIDKYWGNYKSNKDINTLTPQPTGKYTADKEIDIDVPGDSGVYVAVKTPVDEVTKGQVISMLLYNGLDGIFDKMILYGKIESMDEELLYFNDGALDIFRFVAGSKNSMLELKQAYFQGVKQLKEGKFTDTQLKNIKLKIQKAYDVLKNNSGVITSSIEESFVRGADLTDEDKQYNIAMNLTKKDIIEYSNRVFSNQFIVNAYDSSDIKYENLEKPEITSLASNPSSESEFAKEFYAMSSKENNFDKSKLESLEIIDLGKGIKLYYVNNKDNNQYDITYIYPLGYVENNNLNMARELFYEIDIKKIQLEKFQNAMSEKSIMIGMSVFSDQTEFSLTGIDSNKANILEALKLFKEKSSNNIATTDQYAAFKNNMIKKLQEIKENPEFLTSAAPSYVIFGETSWNRMIKSDIEQLNKKEGNFYADLINSLSTKKPDIFAYTSLSKEDIIELIKKTDKFDNITEKKRMEPINIDIPKQKVYVTHANSKTVSLSIVGNFDLASDENTTFALFYNEYENGLNGRTFKEIREKKGLTYNISNVLMGLEKHSYILIDTSTQNDKVNEMIDSVKEFLGDANKLDKKVFESTKQVLVNEYENQSLKGYGLYSDYTQKEMLNLETDRAKTLEAIKAYTFEEYKKIYSEKVKLSNFSIVAVGDKGDINSDDFKKYGEVIKLSAEKLIGE